jgi:hypothetical protein
VGRLAARHEHERGAAVTKPFDPIALKIGRAYKGGRGQMIEAGKLLAGVKATLKHGVWLPWLKANADALGFDHPSTASRLMHLAANPASTHDLWGNSGRGSGNGEWYSPPSLMAPIRTFFGGTIDRDPASCEEANSKWVKALSYYSKEQDGTKHPWVKADGTKGAKVYLNPQFQSEIITQFVDKLIVERANSNCSEAIVTTPVWTEKPWFHKIWKHAAVICFPFKGVSYIPPGKDKAPGFERMSTVLSYYGPRRADFMAAFREIGAVVKVL